MSQPPPKLCAEVDKRDNWSCVRCGASLHTVAGSRHHRKLRSQGGQHAIQNLILLCGSGTTGCHGWVHAHPRLSYESGWMVRSSTAPDQTPVEYFGGRFLYLTPMGGLSDEPEPIH